MRIVAFNKWGVQAVRYPNFFLGEWKQIIKWKLWRRRGCSLGWARPSGNTVLPVECLWRGRVAVVFLILKWRRLHSKNSAWLSGSSTWRGMKPIDIHRQLSETCSDGVMDVKNVRSWVRQFKEGRTSWDVERSSFLKKKTTHHRKLKMQSFLNVITL